MLTRKNSIGRDSGAKLFRCAAHRSRRKVLALNLALSAIIAAPLAPIGSLAAGEDCNISIEEGRLHLNRLETIATEVVLANTAARCRDRLAAFGNTASALDRLLRDIGDNSCRASAPIDASASSRARETVERITAVCGSLERQDKDTQAPQTIVHFAPFWQAVVTSLSAGRMSAIVALIAIGLLGLVALSVVLGWLSRQALAKAWARWGATGPRTKAQDIAVGNGAPSSGDPLPAQPRVERLRTHPFGDIAFVPEGGGPSFQLTSSLLDGRGVTVGRDPRVCDVVVRDAYVSSRHARIWRDRDGLHIEDLNSTNGSWYKDRRIARTTFTYGEVIRLGRLAFSLSQNRTQT